MLETFTVATFAQHLGDTFRLHPDPSRAVDMELIEATELGARSAPASARQERRTPFSIVFRGPQDLRLPQQIYRMEHDQIGAFDLFLVPIGPDEQGLRYEAIFT